MDPTFVDPPLGITVTTPQMAQQVKDLDASTRVDDPVSLVGWLPDRPYVTSPAYEGDIARYRARLDEVRAQVEDRYDALLLVGGSGPIVDMANNHRVHDLITIFVGLDRPVGAECYGVAALAFARDWGDCRALIAGKHVTGHCKEYDYLDGTGFVGTDFSMGPPPYPLEFILRDATGPEGGFHGNVGQAVSVIVDYPFITGRSTHDSVATGQQMVAVLDHGRRRWGW
jgi:putative intracellular protease/amidase